MLLNKFKKLFDGVNWQDMQCHIPLQYMLDKLGKGLIFIRLFFTTQTFVCRTEFFIGFGNAFL